MMVSYKFLSGSLIMGKLIFSITGEVANLEEAIKQVNAEIQAENSSLHILNTSLHETNHAISLKVISIVVVDHAYIRGFICFIHHS